MSDAGRDAQVMQAIGGEPEALEQPQTNGEGETIQLSRDAWNRVLARIDELEQRVEAIEDGENVTTEPDGPPIVKYAQMSEDDRKEHLGTSDHIAVTLHEYWEDIAWGLGGARDQISGEITERRRGVDTKTKANAKYNPSRLRHRLKQKLDRDFQATEIYRGLRALAKLSGGEEHVDDTAGRVHIVGGWYEYHEKATTDGKDVRRVLWRTEK